MKSKVIQLIIICSFLPIFLSGCNQDNSQANQNEDDTSTIEKVTPEEKWSDDKQQKYDRFKQDYSVFSSNLQPNSELLNLLQTQSKTSPNNIEFNIYAKSETDKIVNFTQQYQAFLNSTNELEKVFPEAEKQVVQNVVKQLNSDASNSNISLASIVSLLDDQKLTTTEICQGIQLPLQIITDANNSDCGIFGEQTYIALSKYFTEQNQVLNTEIEKLDRLVAQLDDTEESAIVNEETQNNNNGEPEKLNIIDLLSLFLSIISILISILSLTIVVINYSANEKVRKNIRKSDQKSNNTNQKQNQESNEQVSNYQQQINQLQNDINILKSELNTLHNQSLQLRQLQTNINQPQNQPIHNPHNQPQNQPQKHNPQYQSPPTSIPINSNPRNQSNLPLQKSPSTPPAMESDNIRLAQMYGQNPTNLLQNAIQVGMTKETTNQVLGGVWDNIVLEENRRKGEYFVVSSNNGEDYLFLNPHSVFNSQTLGTINKSGLFICNGNLDKSRKGSEITINKPATVKKTQQGWILSEAGNITLA